MCGHPPGQWATYQWPLPTPEKKRDSPYSHTISYPHPCFPARGGTSGDPFSFMIKFLTILILLSTTRSDKYSTVSSCNIHARPRPAFRCLLLPSGSHTLSIPMSAAPSEPWVGWYRYSTWPITHTHLLLTFQTS